MNRDPLLTNEIVTPSGHVLCKPRTLNLKRRCLPCKIISSCACITCGVYVGHFARKAEKPSVGKYGMLTLATGLLYLGVAGFLNLYPFNDKSIQHKSS